MFNMEQKPCRLILRPKQGLIKRERINLETLWARTHGLENLPNYYLANFRIIWQILLLSGHFICTCERSITTLAQQPANFFF